MVLKRGRSRSRKSRKNPEPHHSRCDTIARNESVVPVTTITSTQDGKNPHPPPYAQFEVELPAVSSQLAPFRQRQLEEDTKGSPYLAPFDHPQVEDEDPIDTTNDIALLEPGRSAQPRRLSSNEQSDTPDSDTDDEMRYPFDDAFDFFRDNPDSENEDQSELFDVTTPQLIQQFSSAHDSLARSTLQSTKTFLTRATMIGIISLYGKARFTLASYEHLVALMKEREHGFTIPSAAKMRQKVFPRLLKNNFVKSDIRSFEAKQSSTQKQVSAQERCKEKEAVVVMPSEWAKLDVRCLHVLREIACIQNCRCGRFVGQTDLRIQSTPHVTRAKDLASQSDVLWVNNDGAPFAAIAGSLIRLHFARSRQTGNGILGLRFNTASYKGESCHTLTGRIVSTEHVVTSQNRELSLKHGIKPNTLSFEQHSLYTRCLSFLHSVCKGEEHSEEEQEDINGSSDSSSGNQVPLTRRTKRRRRQPQQRKEDTIRLHPGDHLTLLHVDIPGTVVVYVNRFWVNRLSDDRNFVYILHFDGDAGFSVETIITVCAPLLVSNSSDQGQQNTSDQQCSTTGYLSNGSRYYKYRLLLYADDFSPRSTLFPKGSVGGFYMSPSGLHVRTRRSQSTIRTISLTPSGVSTNAIFDFILDDIIEGCTAGIPCVDAFGEEVVVFLEVTGFVGDYPASTAAVDLKGHTASSPCTHCSFPRSISTDSSMYAFTTLISFRNSAFRRCQHRSSSSRNFGLSETTAKILGLKVYKANVSEKGRSPLLKLAAEFNTRLEQKSYNPDILLCELDGYDLNVIAPDHLLTGLFKGILTLCFIQLPCDDSRAKLTILLKTTLLQYGYQTQTMLFKKSKLVPGLSMSTLYCILCLLPAALQSLNLLENVPIRRMLFHLHRFYSLAFWWPHLETDGRAAWHLVHGENIHRYHQILQRVASNFIKSVNTYCKLHPDLAKHIDRPNVHRLLELAVHTLPKYNHIYYICELVYEAAHQPLKFFLSRNHTSGSHLHAVQLILAKDWLVRLFALRKICTSDHEKDDDKLTALIGILRLLGGHAVDKLNWFTECSSDILSEVQEYVDHLFEGTIDERLDKWYRDAAINSNAEAKWLIQKPLGELSFPNNRTMFHKRILETLASLSSTSVSTYTLHSSASLDRGFGSATINMHERLHLGDIIQLLMPSGFKSNMFLGGIQTTEGLPTYFLVGALVHSKCGPNWIVVKACSRLSQVTANQIPDLSMDPVVKVRTPEFYSNTTGPFHFIELSGCIRKVGVLPNCSTSNNSTFSLQDNTVCHKSSTLDGGTFFLLPRSMGFPPRRS